jgi:hypothetical protein
MGGRESTPPKGGFSGGFRGVFGGIPGRFCGNRYVQIVRASGAGKEGFVHLWGSGRVILP